MNDLDRRLGESLKSVRAALSESRAARAVGAHAEFRRRLRRRRVTRFAAVAAAAGVMTGVVAIAATQGRDLFERTDRRPAVPAPAPGTYIAVGEAPVGVSVGGNRVWVASGRGAITRVDPSTNRSTGVIPVGGEPSDIALTRDAVWFSDSNDGSVKRLDAGSATFSGTPLSLGSQGVHIDLDVGPDGMVWATSPDLGALVAIDAISGEEVRRVFVASPVELSVAAGSVWALVDGGATLVRYDFDTQQEAVRVPVDDAVKTDMASTASAVYVAEEDGTILKIDPATGEVTARTTADGLSPELAVGKGALWVVSDGEGTDARLEQLSLDDLRPAARSLRFVGTPTDVTLGEGSVWVTDAGRDTVVRLKAPRR
jgi:streptogramin lyase